MASHRPNHPAMKLLREQDLIVTQCGAQLPRRQGGQ
jgi:hypothetical protein